MGLGDVIKGLTMNKTFSNKTAIMIFVLPSFVLFSVIVVIPVVMSFYYSLFSWDGITEPVFNGFGNYIELFIKKDIGFLPAIFNAVKIALASLLIQIPLGLILALLLAEGVKGEKFFRTVYFIPFILSAVVIGQLWMKLYHPKYGMLNQFLELVGLEQYKGMWLADPDKALVAVIIPIIFNLRAIICFSCMQVSRIFLTVSWNPPKLMVQPDGN